MPSLIRFSGPYGYFLGFLFVVVLFLAVRATRAILRGSAATPGAGKEQRSALLFWGGVAAILGLLGQFDGSYRALSQILQASEISPDVVAEGFVISFVPTLFGLGILGFAVAAWGCLHLLARRRPPGGKAVPLVLLALPILWSCTEDVPVPDPVLGRETPSVLEARAEGWSSPGPDTGGNNFLPSGEEGVARIPRGEESGRGPGPHRGVT